MHWRVQFTKDGQNHECGHRHRRYAAAIRCSTVMGTMGYPPRLLYVNDGNVVVHVESWTGEQLGGEPWAPEWRKREAS